jgi:hypothetical protein
MPKHYAVELGTIMYDSCFVFLLRSLDARPFGFGEIFCLKESSIMSAPNH